MGVKAKVYIVLYVFSVKGGEIPGVLGIYGSRRSAEAVLDKGKHYGRYYPHRRRRILERELSLGWKLRVVR